MTASGYPLIIERVRPAGCRGVVGQFDQSGPGEPRPLCRLEVAIVREEVEPRQAGDPKPPFWQIVAVVLVLAALVYLAVLAVIQIYPHQLPPTKNPSFVDNIFDSRVVIVIVRVALIFAAGYVVISVVALIAGRRWLSQLGPFKASYPIARLDQSAEALEGDLQEAVGTIKEARTATG